MLINGKQIAEKVLAEVKAAVAKMKKPPRLAAIMVGRDPNLRGFLEMKEKVAQRVGMEYKIYDFPENITNKELRAKIVAIAKQSLVTGVIIELPLPAHLNTQYILNAVPPEKDPDVLSQKAQGAFFVGRIGSLPAGRKVLPPSVEAVKLICETHNIDVRSKQCVAFGHGLLVGKQVAHWFLLQGATVTVVTEHTIKPENYSRHADIVVSGVGKPGLITGDMIKVGSTVIDFGYNEGVGGVVGDVDFESASKKANLITPVPGGVGPLVIAAVLKNTIILSSK